MNISRTHIAFLAIISIFTGFIAPGTATTSYPVSYLMTDMRLISYAVLLFSILVFTFAALKSWTFFRLSSTLTLLGIVTLCIMTLFSKVHDTRVGLTASGLSWGWLFLVCGSILLIWAYRYEEDEEESIFSRMIDTVVGLIGALGLMSIAGFLIISSFTLFNTNSKVIILDQLFGSGNILSLSSGLHMTKSAYTDIKDLSFERRTDTISMITEIDKTYTLNILSKEKQYSKTVSDDSSILRIGTDIYSEDGQGNVFSGATLLTGAIVTQGEKGIFLKVGNVGKVISQRGIKEISYTGKIYAPYLIENSNELFWNEPSVSGEIMRNEEREIIGGYTYILSRDFTSGGGDIMLLLDQSGSKDVIKNGQKIASLPKEYIEDSYVSNGSHYLYKIRTETGITQVVFDGNILEKKFDNVRETYLEKDGVGYSFFARPVGEKEYCLYTRYHGNICGLSGYMNPRVGADGGSIIFGGKKDGVWGIYRNTDLIIKNTGYTDTDNVSDDYLFFDITNPRTFVFIKKDPYKHTYTLIKNGSTLPEEWEDIGLDASFGFDNHIIMSARDGIGWRVIEL